MYLIAGYGNYDQHQWPGMNQQQTANQSVATESTNQGTDQTDSANQNTDFQHQYQNQGNKINREKTTP